ncbi:hypothetical protein [Brucella vulpis]|uniref:hypothetical protein n=1 Tax=Brucella vulpis TaxID=981386 RepID=UPI000B1BABC3
MPTILNEGGFTAENTYDIIERLGVTSLAGSPTAFRLLMAAGRKLLPASRAVYVWYPVRASR